ncbi:phage terminase small subunit P27 family [Paramagnetospirillum marisnigri]|nr:phage terminase small subunit P27 family [Paramagnetospirillum marisnigri]
MITIFRVTVMRTRVKTSTILRDTGRNKVPPHVKCPAHLVGQARETWDYLAPRLHDIGIFEDVDIYTLESYCVAYSMYRDALAHVQANGTAAATTQKAGGAKSSPQALMLKDMITTMRGLSNELQLHSLSRARAGTTIQHVDNEWSGFSV